jgi:hypothetical protein
MSLNDTAVAARAKHAADAAAKGAVAFSPCRELAVTGQACKTAHMFKLLQYTCPAAFGSIVCDLPYMFDAVRAAADCLSCPAHLEGVYSLHSMSAVS